MTQNDLVKKLQEEMNELGSNLKVDGDLGPKTLAELKKYNLLDISLSLDTDPTPCPMPMPLNGEMPFWVKHLEGRIGWTEFNHDKEISKGWPLVGLPQYNTAIGSRHAWCGVAQALAFNSGGIKPPKGAAGARNWSVFGEKCDYICGAIISMRHAGGGNHVTCFLYWIDEKKKIAACLGGNQGNKYSIAAYNLSGNKAGHNEVIGGPRWPTGYPKTDYKYTPKKVDKPGSTR